MHLRDTFLFQPGEGQPEKEPEKIDFKTALAGIGDPLTRHTPTGFSAGDAVEFTTPDDIVRVGKISRQVSEKDWLVDVEPGLALVVPTAELRSRAAAAPTREDLRAVIQPQLTWTERSALLKTSETDFEIVIDYGMSSSIPSNDDLCEYVREKHQARIVDAEILAPGRIAVLCTTAADLPVESPSEPEMTAEPGLETEEIEGTGRIGFLKETLNRLANMNPEYLWVDGTAIDDGKTAKLSFELRDTNNQLLALTASVEGEEAPVASGELSYDGVEVRGGFFTGESLDKYEIKVHADVLPPYSSGDGPLSVNEDHPGSAEDGDYVVKASEEDGTVREEIAPLGEIVAVDQKAEQYYKKYYKEYGEALVRDQPKKRKRSEMADYIRAAFIESQDRSPSSSELLRTLAALYSIRTARKAIRKVAAPMQTADMIQQLLDGAQADPSIATRLRQLSAQYIAKKPDVLSELGPEILPRIMVSVSQDPAGAKQLSKLWAALPQGLRNRAPETGDPAQPETGDPAQPETGDPKAYPPGKQPEGPGDPLLSGDMGAGEGVWMPQWSIYDAEDEPAFAPYQSEPMENEPASQNEPMENEPAFAPSQNEPALENEPAFVNEPAFQNEPALENEPAFTPTQSEPMEDELTFVPTESEREWAPPWEPVGEKSYVGPPKQGKRAQLLAKLNPRVVKVVGSGSYLKITLQWEPDNAVGMGRANVRQLCISAVKHAASNKEYIDLGFISKPRFISFEPKFGMAVLRVSSSNGRNFPQEIVESSGDFEI